MRKSVFFKLALLIIPIVLAYEIAQLYICPTNRSTTPTLRRSRR